MKAVQQASRHNSAERLAAPEGPLLGPSVLPVDRGMSGEGVGDDGSGHESPPTLQELAYLPKGKQSQPCTALTLRTHVAQIPTRRTHDTSSCTNVLSKSQLEQGRWDVRGGSGGRHHAQWRPQQLGHAHVCRVGGQEQVGAAQRPSHVPGPGGLALDAVAGVAAEAGRAVRSQTHC